MWKSQSSESLPDLVLNSKYCIDSFSQFQLNWDHQVKLGVNEKEFYKNASEALAVICSKKCF